MGTPAPDPNVLLGLCIAERYELEELIGRGPSSLVFRARVLAGEQATALGGGQAVAVKLLFEAAGGDEEREAMLGPSRLGHPSIAKVIEHGRTVEEIPYVVSELLDGSTLAEVLERERLPTEEAIRITLAAASALGVAHAAGFVHGNLKATNLFLTSSGAVKLLDFGRRRAAAPPTTRNVSARWRAMADVVGAWGSSRFRVPTIYGGIELKSRAADARDDVGALVLLLERMLAPGPDPASAEPAPTSELGEEFAPILRVVASARQHRFTSARAFADELERAAARTDQELVKIEVSLKRPIPVDSTSLIGRVFGGRYRAERLIGRGAMSMVFQARHLELESLVALKVLAPLDPGEVDDAVDRFRFEAQILAGLRHVNVVRVFDLGTTEEGLLYLAMELLEGESLAALMRRQPRVTAEVAVGIATEVAEALTVLHERGLIHRDIKPANIFLARDSANVERVKLMDFGLARSLESQSLTDEGVEDVQSPAQVRRRQQTLHGIILGSGGYMSPELIQCQKLDARSDVYALAVVTYRLLAGSLPFTGSDMPQLLARHLNDLPQPPSQRAPDAAIPPAVERVVLRALEKDRERRPATAREFARELVEALAPAGSSAEASELPEPSPLVIAEPEPVAESPVSLHEKQPATPAVAPASARELPRRRLGRWVTGSVTFAASALLLYALFGGRSAETDDAFAPANEQVTTTARPALPAAEPATGSPLGAAATDATPKAAEPRDPESSAGSVPPSRSMDAAPSRQPSTRGTRRGGRRRDGLKEPDWN